MSKIEEWIRPAIEVITPFCLSIELDGLQSRLSSTCEKEFSRGISELAVAKYYVERYPKGIFLPRGNKKDKDIDVSFLAFGQRINIEVKCPDLSHEKSKQFTLVVPYMYGDLMEGKDLERKITEMMGNELNVTPNKVLNLKDFLIDCKEKFEESAEEGDINIVLFSMLDLAWMDDYRIKIEDEGLLSEFDSIHAVVLSNAAYHHKREQKRFPSGFQNCFNYIAVNTNQVSSFSSKQLGLALSCIPNQTKEAKAWFGELVKDDEPIGTIVKGIQRLKLFHKIVLASGNKVNRGDGS